MPYLPARLTAVTTLADLKISGILSADSINHKIAMNSSAGAATDANDHFLFEDGGTDGGGKNAGDNLLLEDVTTANVPFANINVGSSTSGQLLQSQGAGLAPSFATVAGAAIEKLFIATNSGDQAIAHQTWTTATFDTENLDQGGHFASPKFTAPSDGKYMFFFTFQHIAGSGSLDQRANITVYNSSDVSQSSVQISKTDTHEASQDGHRVFTMSATDYAVARVYQTSGSTCNLNLAQFFGWRIV